MKKLTFFLILSMLISSFSYIFQSSVVQGYSYHYYSYDTSSISNSTIGNVILPYYNDSSQITHSVNLNVSNNYEMPLGSHIYPNINNYATVIQQDFLDTFTNETYSKRCATFTNKEVKANITDSWSLTTFYYQNYFKFNSYGSGSHFKTKMLTTTNTSLFTLDWNQNTNIVSLSSYLFTTQNFGVNVDYDLPLFIQLIFITNANLITIRLGNYHNYSLWSFEEVDNIAGVRFDIYWEALVSNITLFDINSNVRIPTHDVITFTTNANYYGNDVSYTYGLFSHQPDNVMYDNCTYFSINDTQYSHNDIMDNFYYTSQYDELLNMSVKAKAYLPLLDLSNLTIELDEFVKADFSAEDFMISIGFQLIENYSIVFTYGGNTIQILCLDGSSYSLYENGVFKLTSAQTYFDKTVYFTLAREDNTYLMYNTIWRTTSYSDFMSESDNAFPILNIYNYNILDENTNTTLPILVKGIEYKPYHSYFDNFKCIVPTHQRILTNKYNAKFLNPIVPQKQYSITNNVSYTIPILPISEFGNYFVRYYSYVSLTQTITFNLTNVVGSRYFSGNYNTTYGNGTTLNTTITDLSAYFDIHNLSINYSTTAIVFQNMATIPHGNFIVNNTILVILYLAEKPESFLDMGINFLAPFILLVIFPYVFHKYWGKKGMALGLVIGFVVYGISGIIDIFEMIFMVALSSILMIYLIKNDKRDN